MAREKDVLADVSMRGPLPESLVRTYKTNTCPMPIATAIGLAPCAFVLNPPATSFIIDALIWAGPILKDPAAPKQKKTENPW